jgi:hypothetical protein
MKNAQAYFFNVPVKHIIPDQVLAALSAKYPDHRDCAVVSLPQTSLQYEFLDMDHRLTLFLTTDEFPPL